VRAIKRGASFVTSGPFLEAVIGGGGPGTMVVAEQGKVSLEVRVRTPPWMEVDTLQVFVGAELRETRAIVPKAPSRPKGGQAARVYREVVSLEVTEDAPVVVRVSGPRPLDDFFGRNAILPVAFTNPIFVDADADGETPWSPRVAEPEAAPAF
jgi:hypothetical protein